MRHLALDVIRDEHQALAAMLRSMSLLVDQARRAGSKILLSAPAPVGLG